MAMTELVGDIGGGGGVSVQQLWALLFTSLRPSCLEFSRLMIK